MSLTQRLGIFLLSIGPGLFLVGYNIGTGSITTMASAGAAHGMMLMWALLLSCIFTYILIVAFSKYTLVTGKTILQTFKNHFGKGISLFILAALIFTELVSSMGVMAIVTQVVQEWSRPLTASGEGFNTIYLTLIFASFLYILFLNGKIPFFEKILIIFVTVMGISFLLSMFIMFPDPKDLVNGLIPSIPKEAGAGILVAGMIGTTMGGVLYVTRSILVKQKGWEEKDLVIEKRDALISASLMFILSISIMAAAAGTLYPLGMRVDNAIDMIKLLEPLLGRFAVSIFVAGIVSAGLSSLFPIVLLAPLLLADYMEEKLDLKSVRSRILVFIGLLMGLVVPVFGGRPVMVMITSQALTLVVTPLIIGLMLVLLRKSTVMGEKHAAPWYLTGTLGLIVLFTAVMTVVGLVGIFNYFF
jgi:manganese transport protein